ncbi:restriction endonuclease subunit R [Methanocalculus chunghsingensis]|uniref:type I site-specific deoxyribonuclease n=1 Tax=Methanocalculus chunghsingensis TaxID=156457 RepID=A0A8J7W871_9EURY|nr:type I restriction endonuclease subunit R [Methanocalculus chunghsingensis]MBR1369278.1 restriction endonuclease subunit R [Methanocalculus chunghsingensis]
MTGVGEREIRAQGRVIGFFRDTLGYTCLGNWHDKERNGSIEETLLRNRLSRQGHEDRIIEKVLHELGRAATVGGVRSLYDANREFYSLLRYGVKVRPAIGEPHITVWPIDWQNPGRNDFAIAEEVTIFGENTKRPDIVIYVNGIALGVLELKRSTVSVTEGIRQNLDNQKKVFIRPFFATIQLVMAGNETEGVRYGTIETPEKYYLRWKEADAHPDAADNPLLRELGQLCRKERLLELIHDFIVFDAGTKKTCRHNQYFGVKAAQERVRQREGGIIWHTQGSGKSLTMVWLAKWIREHIKGSRVLLVTDRIELDEQIEKVFTGVSEAIYRAKSGSDLVNVLNTNEEWLICSLIHKFGRGEELTEQDVDQYIRDIHAHLPKNFRAKGEIFVFIDECHRTQSGLLHEAVKALLPDTMMIGFTGTPLLKKDKKKSIEIFGPYIHTYKYDEAVHDGVVLDLRYEARDIDQNITSQVKIDQWFEAKTAGLTDFAQAELKKRWGTMKKVLSSQDRLQKIVADILLDMEMRDRLRSGHGNAMLVSGSIYSACRFFEMFQKTDLKGRSAIITSYKPSPADIKGEETGEGLTEKLRQYDIYRAMLAEYFDEPEDTAMYKAGIFEKEVKRRFIEEPGQMKLLIVVDKLLTGFDAPPATYLYIDKQMRDHGLFQAICRVNRLDGDDKEYGHIIDYKDLFRSLERSIKDYTGGAFEDFDEDDVRGLLKDRLLKGRERLEEIREAIKALCEPVEPPRASRDYIRYFCGSSDDPIALKRTEPLRVDLYKRAGTFLRRYADIAGEMREAGYTDQEARVIRGEVAHFEKLREEIMRASGDYIDLKRYEPMMRHLLDTYIRAEESEVISAFDDLTLVQLINIRGEAAIEALPEDIRRDHEAVAETIENNVRKIILDEMPVNPKYYEKMSELLDSLIHERKQHALDYRAYLGKIVELARNVSQPEKEVSYPSALTTPALRSLYDNLVTGENQALAELAPYGDRRAENPRAEMAIALDTAIRETKKAGWRGNKFKEREVLGAIRQVLGDHEPLIGRIFEIVKNQRDY